MKYLFLSTAENVVAWARTLVTQLVQNDAAVDAALDAITAKLPAGGTSFPTSPTTGDRFWRSDRQIDYFYDGTRWLSAQIFTLEIGITDALLPRTGTTGALARTANPWFGLYDAYVTAVVFNTYITASSNWSVTVTRYIGVTGVTVGTRSTSADPVGLHTGGRVPVNAITPQNASEYEFTAALNSGASSLYAQAQLNYRLVG